MHLIKVVIKGTLNRLLNSLNFWTLKHCSFTNQVLQQQQKQMLKINDPWSTLHQGQQDYLASSRCSCF